MSNIKREHNLKIREEESEWIERILRGKKQDFEMLVKRYQRLVFSQVFQMVKDMEIAEEITQEVFLSSFTALSSFIPGSSYKSWVLKIAYHRSLDYFRKSKIMFDENYKLKNLVFQGNIEDETLNRDFLSHILSKINLEAQILLHLKYVLDLSYDEMAHLLDDSAGNIKIKIHRIKKYLKKKMKDE
ncbi:RNA polymerase sigma factor [Candidatus Riflebacteria bacterium]